MLFLSSSYVTLGLDAGLLGTEDLIMLNQPDADVPLAYQSPDSDDDEEEEVA